jgi:hypothetical protein
MKKDPQSVILTQISPTHNPLLDAWNSVMTRPQMLTSCVNQSTESSLPQCITIWVYNSQLKHSSRMHPKSHPIPYIVHYSWPDVVWIRCHLWRNPRVHSSVCYTTPTDDSKLLYTCTVARAAQSNSFLRFTKVIRPIIFRTAVLMITTDIIQGSC